MIMFEPVRNIYFYNQWKEIETKNDLNPENVLSRVK